MGKQGGERGPQGRQPGKSRLAGFQREISRFFHSYYQTVHAGIAAGHSNIPPEAVALHPRILLITETSGHFLAELVGATAEFSGLSVVTHKETSIERYLSRFFDESSAPTVAIDTGYTVWKGIPILPLPPCCRERRFVRTFRRGVSNEL